MWFMAPEDEPDGSQQVRLFIRLLGLFDPWRRDCVRTLVMTYQLMLC